MIARELTMITTTSSNNLRIENVCLTVATEFKTTSLISIIARKNIKCPSGPLGQNSKRVTFRPLNATYYSIYQTML